MESKTPLSEIPFCVIDTETTGGNAAFDRVIDVAVFMLQGGVVRKKFSSLINPGRLIPAWITALTGIDDDMVKRAPSYLEVAEDLFSCLNEGVFTAHNAGFDYGFIQAEFARAGISFSDTPVCTLRLARQLLPDLPSRSLGHLCENLLIDISDRHRAHGDAEATAYVLKELLRQLERHHAVKNWGDLQAFLTMGALDLPMGMTLHTVLRLPAEPGIYILRDAEGKEVAKGKVMNLQRRIRTYFKKSNMTPKSNRLRQVVCAIETHPLSG